MCVSNVVAPACLSQGVKVSYLQLEGWRSCSAPFLPGWWRHTSRPRRPAPSSRGRLSGRRETPRYWRPDGSSTRDSSDPTSHRPCTSLSWAPAYPPPYSWAWWARSWVPSRPRGALWYAATGTVLKAQIQNIWLELDWGARRHNRNKFRISLFWRRGFICPSRHCPTPLYYSRSE